MTERRIAFRFVDWLTGDLIMVYERPADAVKRGFNEPFASYGGYVERIPAAKARQLLEDERLRLERRET
jgi:hypothetical protein